MVSTLTKGEANSSVASDMGGGGHDWYATGRSDVDGLDLMYGQNDRNVSHPLQYVYLLHYIIII